MGLHSPFGYVGYTVSMGKSIIDMLERFCGHCHTNDDYNKGCKECPVGNFIYEAREYILTDMEEDKHFALYASDEWQERRKANGQPEESQEERDRWASLSIEHKEESIALRGMKREIKKIKPHPFFYGQWIFDRKRNVDPLLKFREYLKDFEFYSKRIYNDFRILGLVEDSVRERLRDELKPLIMEKFEEEQRNAEV